MSIVKLESVQFTTLINIKGRSRSTSQITAKEADQGQLEMTLVDGHTLRLESPLAVQLIPWARVKSAQEAPGQELTGEDPVVRKNQHVNTKVK